MAIIAQSYGVFLRRWRHFLRRIQAWLSPCSFPLRSHAEQRVPVRQQAQRKNSVVVKTQAQEAKCLDFICSSATSFLDDRSQVSRVRFFFSSSVCAFGAYARSTHPPFGALRGKPEKCRAAKERCRLRAALFRPGEGR